MSSKRIGKIITAGGGGGRDRPGGGVRPGRAGADYPPLDPSPPGSRRPPRSSTAGRFTRSRGSSGRSTGPKAR